MGGLDLLRNDAPVTDDDLRLVLEHVDDVWIMVHEIAARGMTNKRTRKVLGEAVRRGLAYRRCARAAETGYAMYAISDAGDTFVGRA